MLGRGSSRSAAPQWSGWRAGAVIGFVANFVGVVGQQPVCSSPAIADAQSLSSASFLPPTEGKYTLQVTAGTGCDQFSDLVDVNVICASNLVPSLNASSPWPLSSVFTWLPSGGGRWGTVTLNASASRAWQPGVTLLAEPILRHNFRVSSRPTGSLADVVVVGNDPWGPIATFTPDRAGDYAITLTSQQPSCAGASVTVPVAAVCNSTLAVAPPPRIAAVSTVGSSGAAPFPAVLLTPGDGSVLPAAHATVSGVWLLRSAPPGSQAGVMALSRVAGNVTTLLADGSYAVVTPSSTLTAGGNASLYALFRPDVAGEYVLELSVTDGCAVTSGVTTVVATCTGAALPVLWTSPRVVGVGNGLASVARWGASAAPFASSPVVVQGGVPVPLAATFMDATGNATTAPAGVRVQWRLRSVTALTLNGTGPVTVDGTAVSVNATAFVGGGNGSACADDAATLPDERTACTPSAAWIRNDTAATGAYFVPDVLGVYRVEVAVTDNCTTWLREAAVVVGCNTPPQARAGGDVFTRRGLGNAFLPVLLDGSGSTDADAADVALAFQWTLVSAPAGSRLTSGNITSANASIARFTPDADGAYAFRLRVSDFCSVSEDVAVVTVGCNRPPVPSAAAARVPLALDATTNAFRPVVLDGTFSWDPDGVDDIRTYAWRLVAISSSSSNISQAIPAGDARATAYLTPVPAAGITDVPGSPRAGAVVLFTPPATGFTIDADLGGAAVGTAYVLQLTVWDGCSEATANVTLDATCPRSPAVAVSAGPVIVWNTRAGSRFAHPAPAAGAYAADDTEAVRCVDSASPERGCAALISLNGSSRYNYTTEVYDWSWLTAPAGSVYALPAANRSGIAAPTALSTTANVTLLAYDNTAPLAVGSLGVSMAGVLTARLRVTEACVSMAATTAVTFQCNTPPTATVNTAPATLMYTQAATWGSQALSGAISPSSASADAGEAGRDAPTTRYDWTVTFTSTAVPGRHASGVSGSPSATDLSLSGQEIVNAGGMHEVFITSTRYDGNLVGAANALYNRTAGVNGFADGLAAGDAICAHHARAGRLPFPDDFRAHLCLASSPTAGASAPSRFTMTGPMYSTGSYRGGFSTAALIGGSYKVTCGTECSNTMFSDWLSAAAYDEYGRDAGGAFVHNGCDLSGNVLVAAGSQPLCANWTSADSLLSTQVGGSAFRTAQRFNMQSRRCDLSAALTCVRATRRSLSALGYPIGSFRTLVPTFRPTKLGVYNVSLTVTDGCSAASSHVAFTTVCNDAPVVGNGSQAVTVWANRTARFPTTRLDVGQNATDVNGDTLYYDRTIGSRSLYGVNASAVPAVWASGTAAADVRAAVPRTQTQWIAFDADVLATPTRGETALLLDDSVSPTYRPTLAGNVTFNYNVNDGCSISTSAATLAVVCNAPVLLTVSGPPAAVVPPSNANSVAAAFLTRWNGTAFPPIVLAANGTDPERDTVLVSWGDAAGLPLVSAAAAANATAVSGSVFLLPPAYNATGVSVTANSTVTFAPVPATVTTLIAVGNATNATVSPFHAVVLGGNATNATAVVMQRPGTARLRVAAGDGCSVTYDVVEVVAECNAPPIAHVPAQVITSVWRGLGFGFAAVTLDGRGSADPEGFPLDFEWNETAWAAAPHPLPAAGSNGTAFPWPVRTVAPGDVAPASFDLLRDVTVTGGAHRFVTPLNATNSSVAVLQPGALGAFTFTLTVGDRCTAAHLPVTVLVTCDATPQPRVDAVGGGSAAWNSTTSTFSAFLLDGTTSTDASAQTMRFRWGNATHTPVTVAAPAVNATWLAALRIAQAAGSSLPAAPPFVMGHDVETGVAGPVPVGMDASTIGNSTAARTQAMVTRIGVYASPLTVDDGCSAATAVLLTNVTCGAAPVVRTSINLTSTWSNPVNGSGGFAAVPLMAVVSDADSANVSATWSYLPSSFMAAALVSNSSVVPTVTSAGLAAAALQPGAAPYSPHINFTLANASLVAVAVSSAPSQLPRNASYVPLELGSRSFLLRVSDGCNVVYDWVTVTARCNAPPQATLARLSLATEQPIASSSWNVSRWATVVIRATWSDSDGDQAVSPTWTVTDATGNSSSAAVEVVPGSGGLAIRVTPAVAGLHNVTLTVSDGCNRIVATVDLPVGCNSRPVAQSTGQGGTNATIASLFALASTLVLPAGTTAAALVQTNWSTVDSVVSARWNGTGFNVAVLDGRNSSDADNDTLSFAWTSPATSALRFNFTPIASTAGVGVTESASLPDLRPSSEVFVNGPTIGVGVSQVGFLPMVAGVRLVSFTVSDACTASTSSLLVSATCPSPPLIRFASGSAPLVAVWNGTAATFAPTLVNASVSVDGYGSSPAAHGAESLLSFRWAVVSWAHPTAIPNGTAAGVIGTPAAAEVLPAGQATSAAPTVALSRLGTAVLNVTVTDGCTHRTAVVNVTSACNAPPNVAAHPSGVLGSGGEVLVTWNGTSFAPSTMGNASTTRDPDGDPLAVAWSLIAATFTPASPNLASGVVSSVGPNMTVTNNATAVTAVSATVLGNATWRVTVSDGCSVRSDTVRVRAVCNAAPVVNWTASAAVLTSTYSPATGAFSPLQLAVTATDVDAWDNATITWTAVQHTPVANEAPWFPQPSGADSATLTSLVSFAPSLTPTRLGSWRFTATVTDGCNVVSSTVTAVARCPTPVDVPAPTLGAGSVITFIKYAGDESDAAVVANRTLGLRFAAAPDGGASLATAAGARWNFSEWSLVTRTCPDGTVGFWNASSPAVMAGALPPAQDAGNHVTPSGGQCLLLSNPLGALAALGVSAVNYTAWGVGTHTLRYRAFDNCSVVPGFVTVQVTCNPSPVAVVSARAWTVSAASTASIVSATAPGASGLGAAASSGILNVTAASIATLPFVVLNGSASWDGFDATGVLSNRTGATAPLRFVWSLVAAPTNSRLGGVGRTVLQHPNSTTWPLVLASRSGAWANLSALMAAGGTGVDVAQEAGVGGAAVAANALSARLRAAATANSPAAWVSAFVESNALNVEAYTVFQPDVVGTYVVRLTVHDGCSSSTVEMRVVVGCGAAPAITAAASPSTVTVDGVSGFGRDVVPSPGGLVPRSRPAVVLNVTSLAGVPSPADVAFQWTLVAFAPAAGGVPWAARARAAALATPIHNPGGATASFIPVATGVYTLQVAASVTPGHNLTAAVDAGVPGAVDPYQLGGRLCAAALATVTVTVACNDPPVGVVTHVARHGSVLAPLPPAPAAVAGISIGNLTSAAADSRTAQVSVWGVAAAVDGDGHPTSNATAPRFGQVLLTAAASSDADTPLAALAFEWAIVSAPALSLGSALMQRTTTGSLASFVPDRTGVYAVVLTASDGCTSTTTPFWVVAVCNEPPVPQLDVSPPSGVVTLRNVLAVGGTAAAGAASVVLSFAGTVDPSRTPPVDGVAGAPAPDRLSAAWQIVQRPAGSLRAAVGWLSGSPAGAVTSNATFVPDVTGQYVLVGTVTDGCTAVNVTTTITVGCSAPPAVSVNSSVTAIWAPSFALGNRQAIALSAAVADPDDQVVSVVWTIASAPPGANMSRITITGANSTAATVLVDQPGAYTLRVTAADGCSTVVRTIAVSVLCPIPAFNPLTAAGGSRSVAVPAGSRVDLRGAFNTAAYPAGSGFSNATVSTLAVQWSFLAIPALLRLSNYVTTARVPLSLDAVAFTDNAGFPLTASQVASLSITNVQWRAEGLGAANVTLANATTLAPVFTAAAAGVYTLRVTLTAGCNVYNQTTTVTVACGSRPASVASAAPVLAVAPYPGAHVVVVPLDGIAAGTTDTDTPVNLLAWAWSVRVATRDGGGGATPVGVPVTAALLNPTSPAPTLILNATSGVAVDLTRVRAEVTLTVSDGCSNASSTVTVLVRCASTMAVSGPGSPALVAMPLAGRNASLATPDMPTTANATWSATATLAAVADGVLFASPNVSFPAPLTTTPPTAAVATVRWAWTWRTVPSASAVTQASIRTPAGGNGSTVSFTPDVAGAYVATVTATDGCAAASDTAVAVVGATLPYLSGGFGYDTVASAPVHLSRTQLVTSSGVLLTARSSPAAIAAAGVTFAWTVVAAPPSPAGTPLAQRALFVSAAVLAPVFTPDAPGLYSLAVTATTPSGTLMDAVSVLVRCGSAPQVVVSPSSASPSSGLLRSQVPLGATAFLALNGTTDVDTPTTGLVYSWALVGTAQVQRPVSGSRTSVYDATSLATRVSTSLTSSSITPLRALPSTAGNGSDPFAAFTSDGLGVLFVAGTVSDGCSSAAVTTTVEVTCPPAPEVDAGPDVVVRRTVTLPIAAPTGLGATTPGPTPLAPAGAAAAALFGPITLSATAAVWTVTSLGVAATSTPAASTAAGTVHYAWIAVSAPAGSSVVTTPSGALPARSGSGSSLPAGVLSTAANWTFTPDADGSFLFRVWVSDGCSLASDYVVVSAVVERVQPAPSVCPFTPTPSITRSTTPSPSASATRSPAASTNASPSGTGSPSTSPAPVTCPRVAEQRSDATVTFTITLAGVSPTTLLASTALRSALITTIATRAGVPTSSIVLVTIGGVPVSSGRRLQSGGGSSTSSDVQFRVVSSTTTGGGVLDATSLVSTITTATTTGALATTFNSQPAAQSAGVSATSAALTEAPQSAVTNTVVVDRVIIQERAGSGFFDTSAGGFVAPLTLLVLLVAALLIAAGVVVWRMRTASASSPRLAGGRKGTMMDKARQNAGSGGNSAASSALPSPSSTPRGGGSGLRTPTRSQLPGSTRAADYKAGDPPVSPRGVGVAVGVGGGLRSGPSGRLRPAVSAHAGDGGADAIARSTSVGMSRSPSASGIRRTTSSGALAAGAGGPLSPTGSMRAPYGGGGGGGGGVLTARSPSVRAGMTSAFPSGSGAGSPMMGDPTFSGANPITTPRPGGMVGLPYRRPPAGVLSPTGASSMSAMSGGYGGPGIAPVPVGMDPYRSGAVGGMTRAASRRDFV